MLNYVVLYYAIVILCNCFYVIMSIITRHTTREHPKVANVATKYPLLAKMSMRPTPEGLDRHVPLLLLFSLQTIVKKTVFYCNSFETNQSIIT